MSLQSVYDSEIARKGPSELAPCGALLKELKVVILVACIEVLGKAIDELKRDIVIFMHKTRHAGVDVPDSEEDDE